MKTDLSVFIMVMAVIVNVWLVVIVYLLTSIRSMVRTHIFKQRMKIFEEVKAELEFLRPHFEAEIARTRKDGKSH